MSDKEAKPLIVEGAVDVSRALKFWEMRERSLEALKFCYEMAVDTGLNFKAKLVGELIKAIEGV